jgi:hypothetical protein
MASFPGSERALTPPGCAPPPAQPLKRRGQAAIPLLGGPEGLLGVPHLRHRPSLEPATSARSAGSDGAP